MKIKNMIKGILIVLIGVLLLVFREEAATGIKQGIKTCLEILVPSLFPFMVLSSFAVKYGVLSGGDGKAGNLFQRITGLPFATLTVIFFGFTGGFPVGLNVAAELYENGVIDRKTVLRLLSFCVNAGPAFIITAVGTMIFGSSGAGFRLFFCVCSASLITGLLTSLIIKTDKRTESVNLKNRSFSDVFISSVEISCKNIFILCGWVLLFSCFSGIIESLSSPLIADIWYVFGEVTAGVVSAEKIGGLPLTAACISFGGLCVMCQLLPAMKKCGVRIHEYLTFRIVNSFVSYFMMKAVLAFFPISMETFSYADIRLGTGCASASIILLITSVVFVADISSGRVKTLSIRDLF